MVPYVPEKTDFGGSSVSDLNNFVPSGGNYTLAVEGTANQEITVNGGKYSYTPETTGTVRFVSYNGTVYVYEGNEYKGTLALSANATFPDIYNETDDAQAKTGIYSESNLFKNPGFETSASEATTDYPPADWIADANGNSRVRVNPGGISNIEGRGVMMAHQGCALAQTSIQLKPNTTYKLQFRRWSHNNNGQSAGKWYVGFGSEYEIPADNKFDYSKIDFSIYRGEFSNGSSNNAVEYNDAFTFTTGENLPENIVFTVYPYDRNGGSNPPISNYDRMTLVEGVVGKGITGTTSATYLEGEAYAPEISGAVYDMTSYIVNADCENGTNGWTGEKTVGNPIGNKKVTNDVLTENSIEIWRASGSTSPDTRRIYQTINNLPNGTYRIEAAIFAIDQQTTANENTGTIELFANNQATSVTIYDYEANPDGQNETSALASAQVYTVTAPVYDGNLTLGVRDNQSHSNWFGFDNFKLYYLGYDVTAAIAQLKETVEATSSLTESDMNSAVKTQLNEAISTANSIISAGSGTEEDITNAATNLSKAIEAANASISAYQQLAVYLPKAIEQANAIQGIEAISALVNEINGKYDKKELTGMQDVYDFQVSIALAIKESSALVLTSLIQNPETNTNGNDLPEGWTGVEKGNTWATASQYPNDNDKRYLDSWAGSGLLFTVNQNLPALPAGNYILSVEARTDGSGFYLYADADGTTSQAEVLNFGSTNGALGGGWSTYYVNFSISENSEIAPTIGISTNPAYSKGDAFTGSWASATNFKLYYTNNDYVVVGDKAFGTIPQEVNILAEKTSIDITEATLPESGLTSENPNLIVYTTENKTVNNAINVVDDNTGDIELKEGYPFNAPTAITAASVAYTRSAFTNDESTKVNHKTLRGWQTICLPFDVTEISAEKNQFSVPLKPIMSSDFDNGVDDTNDNYAHPFWLYAIINGELAPATEIKANVPYLMLVPNDPDFYAPFYNIPGDITFKGNAIAATDLKVQDGSDYDLLGYFGGTAENLPVQDGTTYYGLNAEGSAFVQTGFARIASFQAFATLPTTPQAAPQTLSIFDDGDGQLTALPNIREALGDRASGIQVYTADGGIRIESAKACSVTVYTVDGQALQTVALTAGGSEFVALPAGKYIVNGTVVIAQ